MIIETQYKNAENFLNGQAIIEKNNYYGMIDKKGNILLHPRFNEIKISPNQLYTVKINNYVGILTKLNCGK